MSDTAPSATVPVGDYLAALPLSDAQRSQVATSAGEHCGFAELQQQLAQLADTTGIDADSCARLQLAHPQLPAELLPTDQQGRQRLATTPALQRSSMSPLPLPRNPLRYLLYRLHRHLRGGAIGLQGAPFEPAPTRSRWQGAALRRRLTLVTLIVLQTIFATWGMLAVLPYHGGTWLELSQLVVFSILFAWVSAGFWTAMMGFWVLLLGGDRFAISASTTATRPAPEPDARTAILVPIYNENAARVYAGLAASWRSIQASAAADQVDIFILSDSTERDTRVDEVEGWLQLCRQVNGFGRIYYRRRKHRIKRKSGNVADWCRRWGKSYRYMVIFDADSVMSGSCIQRLIQMMAANPQAGIIQTAPQAAGRSTLYARIQQFANRVYGPLFTAGLHFWQLGESHYWGHNAIIRVAPFMRHCALGRLPGKGPLAGEILSHDFVEAALMRRAGWAVWMAYDLPGSFEEMPPTLLDELGRDRRWCQGNLQNFRLFLAQGLHPAHRAVFITGVMAYLSAPLWFLSLALSTALLAVHTLVEPTYFTQPYQLFPIWPQWHPEWAIGLFGATALLLFLPKVLALLLLLAKGSRDYGGPWRLGLSTFLEALFSALLAPTRMLFHTRFVLFALVGWSVQWQSPPRSDSATSWAMALRRHSFDSLLGLLWAAGVYWLNPSFLWWLLPVAGAMVISIPLSVYSSRITLGRACQRQRLFLIPEETRTPRALRWLRYYLRQLHFVTGGWHRAITSPVTSALYGLWLLPRSAHHQASDADPLGSREQLLAAHQAWWEGEGKQDQGPVLTR